MLNENLLKEIITYYETRYMISFDGLHPSDQEVQAKFALNEDDLEWAKIKANEVFEKRRIPKIPIVEKPADYIDPEFAVAARLLSTYMDKRAKKVKLEECGLSLTEWNALLRRPANRLYFEKLVEETRNSLNPMADLALARLIDNDDLNAVKYLHQITGQYKEQLSPQAGGGTQVVFQLIAQMMEILARHVDQKTLQRVAIEVSENFNILETVEKRQLSSTNAFKETVENQIKL